MSKENNESVIMKLEGAYGRKGTDLSGSSMKLSMTIEMSPGVYKRYKDEGIDLHDHASKCVEYAGKQLIEERSRYMFHILTSPDDFLKEDGENENQR